MNLLQNKRILLGVTGGIAAYKSVELVRRLRERGCEVRVVMTAGAQEFIRPLTFQAVSGQPVRTHLFDNEAEAAMGHIELARWADAILIAPCSAHTLARLAQGLAEDLLSTLCLAADCPLAIAPAMNRVMWSKEATQENLKLLKSREVHVIGPDAGAQACGEVGEGRMLEPLSLVEAVNGLFSVLSLSGRKVLITAGPTRESIDPVRFLSNYSSGKMGYALASAAVEAGADVTLISGPVALAVPEGVKRIDVESAMEMHTEVMHRVQACDIFIACAAVADYRLAEPHVLKLKKDSDVLELKLVRNPDILADVAALPKAPFTLGFAAETDRLREHALAKLKQKGVNMIAANLVGHGKGFAADDNALQVFWAEGEREFSLMPKTKLARQLLALVAKLYPVHIRPHAKKEKRTTENS
ncbi:MAG TPA: bifunctional phosphopantothenoylcysteine decarboxylase/phosphopantothenate--cysteine ligase CoaBC [Gammaproteobacteria bacterium]|nr:bifunctional phosphopantothenoylcysteine decarboxylase/phosphopantothenate--cysteine ligase CoaBC [Gammaproteobacteria bacterium]